MKNKILYVFFTVITLLFCFVFSASAGFDLSADEILELDVVENDFECYAVGDVDGNGAIKSDDARFILRVAVKLEAIDTSAFMKADVDGDGKITAADARLALRLATGLDDIPEHNVQEIVIVPATCSTEGLTVKFCTSCVKLFAKITLPATTDKHVTGGWETITAPDCQNKGLAQKKCIYCDTVVREEELSATGKHSGEWTYPDGKDCYNPVKKTRTCTVCGTFESAVENPQGGHSYKWFTVTEKTCTEDGVQVYKCTNCGLVNKEAPLPATGHIYEFDVVITEPTCTETGLNAKKCVNCDAVKEKYATEALGHDFNNKHYTVTKEATCSEEGTADVICSRCGDAEELILDKIAHTLTGEWTVTLEPDCVNEGTKTGNCQFCGDVTEVIPANGHTVDKWKKIKNATCYEEGIMQGSCSVCGDQSATKPIEKTAHNFNTKEIFWTSGILCKENGEGYYKCKNCDARQEIILLQRPCTNENFKNTRIVTVATCTTAATEIKVCDFCKEDIEGTITTTGKKLGHDFESGEWVEDQTATCTTEGSEHRQCSRCDEVETRTTAAFGHTPGEWEVTEAATCAKAGTQIRRCTTCGEIAETAEIARAEHTPENRIIADSAFIENGNYVVRCVVVCSVCDEVISEEGTIKKIAVYSSDESIKVAFDESELNPGDTIFFSIEGNTEDLVVLFSFRMNTPEPVEEIAPGLYSFVLPEDIEDTETVIISIFNMAE